MSPLLVPDTMATVGAAILFASALFIPVMTSIVLSYVTYDRRQADSTSLPCHSTGVPK
jgi:hypothetical protein